MSEVYMPREDTKLILDQIRHFAKGNVLDMGTGSGVLAIAAARTKGVDYVAGVDINKNALNFAKTRAAGLKNIEFLYSDLFSVFKNKDIKFDLILCNAPYLPLDAREPSDIRLATTGGVKGYELLDRFFSSVSRYLMPDGKVLIVFSP